MKIIKFSAEWCWPCAAYAPVFKRAMEKYPEVTVENIDVDKDPEIGWKYRVMSIPCTIVTDLNWEEIFRKVWPMTESDIDEVIKQYFNI